MSRDKQIEELAKTCPYNVRGRCGLDETICTTDCEVAKWGWEKASDVAREIFAEIDKISDRIRRTIQYGCHLYTRVGNADSPASIREMGRFEGVERFGKEIADLKKKYESEGEE